MQPILMSLYNIPLFSFGVFIIFAWLVWSFMFWRGLRAEGIEEDRIFDLMFYASIVALVVARFVFVASHWSQFTDNVLKVAALWIAPGLSFMGALLAGVVMLLSLSRMYRIRASMVLDTIAVTLPVAFVIGKIGSFLDGSEIGKIASIPWAIQYVGFTEMRHPVQLYEAFVLFMLAIIVLAMDQRAKKHKWLYGRVGIYFFLILSSTLFVLEFFKDSPVYWGILSANQWVWILVFAQATGAFYVRGGGRELVKRLGSLLRQKFVVLKNRFPRKSNV